MFLSSAIRGHGCTDQHSSHNLNQYHQQPLPPQPKLGQTCTLIGQGINAPISFSCIDSSTLQIKGRRDPAVILNGVYRCIDNQVSSYRECCHK